MSQKYKVFINNKAKVITDNWEEFCSKLTLIKAAGGLVYNQENKLLMIFRNGKWDLPKGKLEEGESIENCAIREVEEECGISNLQIICAYGLCSQNLLPHILMLLRPSNWNIN